MNKTFLILLLSPVVAFAQPTVPATTSFTRTLLRCTDANCVATLVGLTSPTNGTTAGQVTNIVSGLIVSSNLASILMLNTASNLMVKKSGDTMTGNLSMGSQSILSVLGWAQFGLLNVGLNESVVVEDGAVGKADGNWYIHANGNAYFTGVISGNGSGLSNVVGALPKFGTQFTTDGTVTNLANPLNISVVNAGQTTITNVIFLNGVDFQTNSWTANTALRLDGTNYLYVASADITIGVTALANVPTSTERCGLLHVISNGHTVTFTNPVSMHASDFKTSRVVSNCLDYAVNRIPITWTNSAVAQF